MAFLTISFCCPILEGYGQTENNAAGTVTSALDTTTGHVGGPVRCVEMKLVDVPQMNYFATDELDGVPHPRGEICCRGRAVIPGIPLTPFTIRKVISKHHLRTRRHLTQTDGCTLVTSESSYRMEL